MCGKGGGGGTEGGREGGREGEECGVNEAQTRSSVVKKL